MRGLKGRVALFGWELGANLGHLIPMIPLMQGLSKLGMRIVLVACDLSLAPIVRAAVPATILQAPIWPAQRRLNQQQAAASYSDLLGLVGFADSSRLSTMLLAWDGILDAIQPDLVIADHSPGLILAMRGRQTPVVSIGTCYTMPPLEWPEFPALRLELAPLFPQEKLLASIRHVLISRGAEAPKTITEAFRTQERFVFGIEALDPYSAYRKETLAASPEKAPRLAPAPTEPHVFGYLSSDIPNLDALVQALSRVQAKVTVFLRGDGGPAADFLKMRGHTVLDQPVALSTILPECTLVLSSAGAYTTQAAILAGRPQLLLPTQHEASLNADIITSLGLGIRLDPRGTDVYLAAAIQDAASDPALIQRCADFAKQLGGKPASTVDQLIKRMTSLIQPA